MAEGAIISVVASIIRLLGTPAFKELGNFWGHKKKFEKLEKTMSLLEAVIHDAEAKQVDSHQIKHWLQRLEDAVYDVDNLLGEFQTEALRRQVMSGNEATTKLKAESQVCPFPLFAFGSSPRRRWTKLRISDHGSLPGSRHPLRHLFLARPL